MRFGSATPGGRLGVETSLSNFHYAFLILAILGVAILAYAALVPYPTPTTVHYFRLTEGAGPNGYYYYNTTTLQGNAKVTGMIGLSGYEFAYQEPNPFTSIITESLYTTLVNSQGFNLNNALFSSQNGDLTYFGHNDTASFRFQFTMPSTEPVVFVVNPHVANVTIWITETIPKTSTPLVVLGSAFAGAGIVVEFWLWRGASKHPK